MYVLKKKWWQDKLQTTKWIPMGIEHRDERSSECTFLYESHKSFIHMLQNLKISFQNNMLFLLAIRLI
jgi:hypothetical protein